MSVQELKKYILKSKYARYNRELKRRENYSEAVNRVRQMMLEEYPMAADLVNWAYDEVEEETALGSQRAMQFGGTPVQRHNARIYNCTSSYADRLRFFQEAFYLLLCGCGTGFSVQKHHVAELPPFSGCEYERVRNPFCMVDSVRSAVFVVPDTIEGWSDALGVLLSCYFENGPFPGYYGCHVTFDFSKIRPKGSYLSSGAGRAPGPDPLRRSLEKIRALLDRCIWNGQDRLRPIDVYDIVMHASDAVLAGGVRRSATICVFSPDDYEMATAKIGDWGRENPQRARSNNSALLVRSRTSYEKFAELMAHVREWGEPGFVWADSTEFLVNPCVEIGMWPQLRTSLYNCELLKDYQGPIGYDSGDLMCDLGSCVLSGWQFCNLTTINGNKVKTEEDFYKACRVAAIVGTLQAGFTRFPYLGKVTEEIVKEEALLGVSITSIMSNPGVMLRPEVLRRGAQIVLDTNEEVAALIGINACARGTCMKPEGTGTLMLGSLGCGAHAWPFRKGIKNIQANVNEPVYEWFRTVNPQACDRSVWCQNGSTDVISFPIEAPATALIEGDHTAVEFLSIVKTIFENWVVPGKRPERCTQGWLHHSVSNTVKVRDHEWGDVSRYIYDNRNSFAGISLLPACGDRDYEQAPNIGVYSYEEMIEMYGLDAVDIAMLNIDAVIEPFDNNLFRACDAIANWPSRDGLERHQAMVIEYVHMVMFEHIEISARDICLLLKDVFNWRRYCMLKETFREVDYDRFIEEEDDTDLAAEASCAGGACVI